MKTQRRNTRPAGIRSCRICVSWRSRSRRAAAEDDELPGEKSMEPVQLERFYLGCLAHASYMIVSKGVAAVIDPQRDVDIYLEAAAGRNLKIEYIIETHVHADFVSGHRELPERTGARIYLGAESGAESPHLAVQDGDEIQFGDCCLRFLHTPGHTLES